jgi:hypothetical protein
MNFLGDRQALKRWLWLVGLLAFLGLLSAGILVSRISAFAAPDQPVAFSHRVHNDSGVQCLYCHPNVMRSDLAGIPSVQACAGCHQTIKRDQDSVQAVIEYWEQGQPIPWQAVTEMADHVFFSHKPHALAGVTCETCHGPIGEMDRIRPAVVMDMGWCLECHYQQSTENVARLADCLTCHE